MQVTMRVEILDQATADLLEINQYYREIGGKALASKMLARIKAPILALKTHPEMAAPYELASGIRRLVVARGAFLVFYRIHGGGAGLIVQILHIRRSERMPAPTHELNVPRQ